MNTKKRRQNKATYVWKQSFKHAALKGTWNSDVSRTCRQDSLKREICRETVQLTNDGLDHAKYQIVNIWIIYGYELPGVSELRVTIRVAFLLSQKDKL